MLALFLAVALAGTPVESVVAVVNGVPILDSDVQLAEIARLVPAETDETAEEHRRAVAEALIALELRWQDLQAASIAARTPVDFDAAWAKVVTAVGGQDALETKLSSSGLSADALRYLIRRAAVVEAYVSSRFEPFVRPTESEIESAWRDRFAPQLRSQGKPVPSLDEVHDSVAAVLREEKLASEVDHWTEDLARRGEVVRYYR